MLRLQKLLLNFLFGLFLGSVVTHIGLKYSTQESSDIFHLKVLSREKYFSTPITHVEDEELQHRDIAILGEDVLSNWMSPRVRILCWILTSPENLQEKAIHVKATWARRCNTVLFVSSENTDFPTIAVADNEGRKYLWQKTRGAFDYIYKHYRDKADWFLKADDDTYVIVENLRKLLSLYDTEKPIFFGRKFKLMNNKKVVYMQGGAGYVLSRKAVELLVEKLLKSRFYARMKKWNPAEDVMISMLLLQGGVKEGYSRDGIHERFHAVAPNETIVPVPHELTAHNFYQVEQGPECCSDYTISFHHVTPATMYWLEYMVYRMRPFGVGYHMCPADIRTILGLTEVPSAESVDAIETHNVTQFHLGNKEEPTSKKSEEKPKPEKKRGKRRRRRRRKKTQI